MGDKYIKMNKNIRILELKNIKKYYNNSCILDGFSTVFDNTRVNCIMGASGTGKTTLLNIIMGLVKADEGTILYNEENKHYRISAVFQETCLVNHLNPVINVLMVLDKKSDKKSNKKAVQHELLKLLDKEALVKPCEKLSGGMKRRVEIVRAMMADSDVIIMDEPFAGLDDNTKAVAIQYIMDNIRGRILILSTHDETDVKKLSANVLFIDNKVACCYNNV